MVEIKEIRCQNGLKLLMQLSDRSIVEVAVFLYHGTEKDGIHICMPSQVGCPIGCAFCSTTHSPRPYIRNLDECELCDIIHHIQSQHTQFSKVDVLSFSGHGEPLLNLESICKCIKHFQGSIENCFITTVGIQNGIKKIMSCNDLSSIRFFISLHGATDLERSQIIPSNDMIANMDELSSFAKYLLSKGKTVTFNYMLAQHNTSARSAKQLADYLVNIGRVNIRFTPVYPGKVGEFPFISPNADTFLSLFSHYISDSGISWRISTPIGSEIGIACGQMRAYMLAEEACK